MKEDQITPDSVSDQNESTNDTMRDSSHEDTPVTRLRDFLLIILAGFFQLFEKSVIILFGIVIAIISLLYVVFTMLGY